VQVTWTRFVDPTENAFAVDVPQGWTVRGGVKRLSTIAAPIWVTAMSPDGHVQVFLGDPALPPFNLPKPNQAEGSPVQSTLAQIPPGVALGYRPGAEFAKYYGPNSLATASCAGATLTGTEPMPDLARQQHDRAVEITRGLSLPGMTYTPPQHDAGIAMFSCQIGGAAMAAGVIADTAQPIPAGFWNATVSGYLATPEQAPWARAIANHIIFSVQFNPQWDQGMRDATQGLINHMNQEAAQVSALMQQQARQFSEMMAAKSQADMARMTANHNAFMDQMNEQGARRNAQFAADMARKDLNTWRFTAHIRNGELYRDPTTGRIFEVDP
jgi:hypothetical protein